MIVAEHPEWQLEICGDGELETEVRAEVERLGISGSVIMHGNVSDISDMYSKSAMLLLCSHTEGLPMVLIEAMRNGLPAVSTDCPYGPADIIKNGENGYLVPMNDDTGFVDAVSVLIGDDVLRKEMGKKALETSARFSREVIIRRWKELFVKR
jgi:glycosyltransferase involved in cell wall biosynthesis